MKVMKMSMKVLFLLLALAMVGCAGEEKADVSPKSKKTTAKQVPIKKSAKEKLTSRLARIPLAQTLTRFSIHRMNERRGSNDLLKKPYKLKVNENLTIIGVAVDDIAQKPAKEVYLMLNGKDYIPTNYGGNSEGFAKSAKNDNYKNAGFRVTVPYARLKKGKNDIKILIVGATGKYKFVQPRIYSVIK